MKQSEKPANEGMAFGYYRTSILAALINGISLILITIWILWEANSRFQHPEHVSPTWMFKSAELHMLGDAVASTGVIIGGIIIFSPLDMSTTPF